MTRIIETARTTEELVKTVKRTDTSNIRVLREQAEFLPQEVKMIALYLEYVRYSKLVSDGERTGDRDELNLGVLQIVHHEISVNLGGMDACRLAYIRRCLIKHR